jgi:hypothetical protein
VTVNPLYAAKDKSAAQFFSGTVNCRRFHILFCNGYGMLRELPLLKPQHIRVRPLYCHF